MKDIESAIKILKNGGVILYPTDTIWGLGCDATDEDAVERLYKIKQRPDSKAMISLTDSVNSLEKWICHIPEKAISEIEKSGDRPVTIIYDSPQGIAPSLLAEDGSAGFRITNHKFSNLLCKLLEKPLVSTSANISGLPSPKSFFDIDDLIKNQVDYICHSERENAGGIPSRILKITGLGKMDIIRE